MLSTISDYVVLKNIHLSCIAITFLLFNIRAIGRLSNSSWVQQKWLRIVPHTVDTLLLISGILLANLLQQYPFIHPWLTAKFFALIAYIIFGSITLKQAKTWKVQFLSYLVAQGAFLYLVLTALLHHPNPKYWYLLLN
ncbi:SirB2 family protein [Candidatus Albibeggiatoa sp. nov. NOAA]|uniref:SirB2 family protein n=1 Tax=Candidatus Albibeggiatoa sp. nov. NOAA TaxID=3162724 RepID=UPI0032FB908F|nr:SirB2 family protein [Thiotrichaceae bacterium]